MAWENLKAMTGQELTIPVSRSIDVVYGPKPKDPKNRGMRCSSGLETTEFRYTLAGIYVPDVHNMVAFLQLISEEHGDFLLPTNSHLYLQDDSNKRVREVKKVYKVANREGIVSRFSTVDSLAGSFDPVTETYCRNDPTVFVLNNLARSANEKTDYWYSAEIHGVIGDFERLVEGYEKV